MQKRFTGINYFGVVLLFTRIIDPTFWCSVKRIAHHTQGKSVNLSILILNNTYKSICENQIIFI